jgi:hypothetical protein
VAPISKTINMINRINIRLFFLSLHNHAGSFASNDEGGWLEQERAG